MKIGVLENFAKFTGKHLWFAKFSKNYKFSKIFLQNSSGRLLLAFSCNVTKMGVLPTMFGKPQMNIHDLGTLTSEVPFKYVISFFDRIKFHESFIKFFGRINVFIGLHCLLPKETINVLKDFVNFIGKHLC